MMYNFIDSDIVYLMAGISPRQCEFEKLRVLYASIRMKMAAGIEKDWERVIYQEFRIDGNTGTFAGTGYPFYITYDHPKVHKPMRPIYISNEPEAWLTMLAPYLEDGFIQISSLKLSSSKCYAIKDGNLYDARRCTGHTADYFGADYRLLYRIDYHYNNEGDWVEDTREGQDSNTGTWFSYGSRANNDIMKEAIWFLQK